MRLSYTNEYRIKMLEEKVEKVLRCLKDWDGTGWIARDNLKIGLNWDALQIDPPDAKEQKREHKHKRKITLRREEEMGWIKEMEELEAIADNDCL